MPASPLTLHEREEIRAGIERREPDRVIAQRLGRHRLTVNAEVTRNGGRGAYSAVDAQGRADAQRSRPKVPKLVAAPDLAAHVAARLEAKDSPMTIARELGRRARHHRVHQPRVHLPGDLRPWSGWPAQGAARAPPPPPTLPQAPPQGRPSGREEEPVGPVQPHRQPSGRRRGAYRGRPLGGGPDHRRLQPLGDRHGVRPQQSPRVVGRDPRTTVRRRPWPRSARSSSASQSPSGAPSPGIQGREMARHKELAELCGIDV